MKHKLLFALGLIVLVCAMFASVPAGAFLTQSGPYYATPSWDQTMDYYRFYVLTNMNSEAVLDRETGLVWEQSPDIIKDAVGLVWVDAQTHCNNLKKGNRMGWRLPTLQELASLVDPKQVNPALPIGHPFSNVQSYFYWSATTYYTVNTDFAWVVDFNAGGVIWEYKGINGSPRYVWCVRGGQGVNPQ